MGATGGCSGGGIAGPVSASVNGSAACGHGGGNVERQTGQTQLGTCMIIFVTEPHLGQTKQPSVNGTRGECADIRQFLSRKNLPGKAQTNGANSFAALRATISFSSIALSIALKFCNLQAKIVPPKPARAAHEGRLDPASINSWPMSAQTWALSIHARCPQERCSIHRRT